MLNPTQVHSIDPVTFEVLNHRFMTISDEMGIQYMRCSGSNVLITGNDAAAAIMLADGSLVSVGPYIVTQGNVLPLIVDSTMKSLGPGEVIEEKISLSERFGLWVSFYPFSQDEYLAITAQWLSSFGVAPGAIEAARPEALVWALERGSRSGRVAYQFARDYAGRHPA